MNRVGLTFRFPEKAGAYEAALREAGLDAVRLSPGEDHLLEGLAGLCLSGGTDLDPALYGEEPAPETDPPDRLRDAMESRLLKEALDRDLPVLAICRGFQLFNVVHSGTLRQHIEGHRGVTHQIGVHAGTKLAGILGIGPYTVNSRHHQAIAITGSGLAVSAIAADGVVEGLERPDRRFAVAVQWHPEDRIAVSAGDRRLFEAFAEAVNT